MTPQEDHSLEYCNYMQMNLHLSLHDHILGFFLCLTLHRMGGTQRTRQLFQYFSLSSSFSVCFTMPYSLHIIHALYQIINYSFSHGLF